MREHWRANFCFCATVENVCLRAHEGDGDALCHGVDEVRECIPREGEAASLKASCVTGKALEVCGQCQSSPLACPNGGVLSPHHSQGNEPRFRTSHHRWIFSSRADEKKGTMPHLPIIHSNGNNNNHTVCTLGNMSGAFQRSRLT